MFLTDDDMVECPYNSTHRMLRKRLQQHLLKCRKHYKNSELRKCPFNITHLIPEPEFANHATNCPDRKLITQYKYDTPQQKEEEIPKHAPIECDENWDDTHVKDFNPRINLKKAKVLLRPKGSSKSERKKFIKKERKRLGDGDSSDDERKATSVNRPRDNYYRDNSSPTSSVNRPRDNYYRDNSSPTSSVKRSRDNYYRDNYSPTSYYKEERRRYNRRSRSISPCSSSYSRQRSRSPAFRTTRSRSRSPRFLRRSQRDYTPPPRYTLPGFPNYYPPYSSYAHYYAYSHLSAQDRYYENSGRIARNDHRGRDDYYSEERQAYYVRHSEMPPAPPPPMISYSKSKYVYRK